MRVLILATLAVVFLASTADARCLLSYCRDRTTETTPTRNYITNQHRQIIGDLYDPGGHGRRIQIRDTSRRIIGFIESDGTITDTSRRKVGSIDKVR